MKLTEMVTLKLFKWSW